METKKTFLFYTSWLESLAYLDPADFTMIILALGRYAAGGPRPELPERKELKAVMQIMLDCIDINNDKYQEISRKRSEAGKKGSVARWSKAAERQSDADCDMANMPIKDKDKDKEKDKEKDNDSLKDERGAESGVRAVGDDSSAGVDKPQYVTTKDVRQVLKSFNDAVAGTAIPAAAGMPTRRRRLIEGRLAEHGRRAVGEVIGRAASTPFLNGSGGGRFCATIDWLFDQDNFVKVLEGNYDERRAVKAATAEAVSRERDTDRRRADAERDRSDRMRRRYAARVPGAFTDAAPLTFLQYRLMGLDSLDDAACAAALGDIAAGRRAVTSLDDLAAAETRARAIIQ